MVFNLFKNPGCVVCGHSPQGNIIYEGRRSKSFCSSHLHEAFEKEFLNSPYQMIVCHPLIERTGSFTFYPFSEMKRAQFSQKDIERVKGLLYQSSRSRWCQKCRESVTNTIYFNSTYHSSLYQQKGVFWTTFSGPFLSLLPKIGPPFCLKCIWEEIAPQIGQTYTRYIVLKAPYKEWGIYVSSYR